MNVKKFFAYFFIIILVIAVFGVIFFFLIAPSEETPYQFLILPIPPGEQEYINDSNPFNENNSDGTRDKAFDFKFVFDPDSENITEEDLLNGYKLRKIVAPCDGNIVSIHHAYDYYCPGYGIMIGIKHNDNWITSIGLETNTNDTGDIEVQNEQIFVNEGDEVNRGDLLAYFLVSNRTLTGLPNSSDPLIDWGLYPTEGGALSEELRENAVCPYTHCINEARLDLENLFRLPDGTVDIICVP